MRNCKFQILLVFVLIFAIVLICVFANISLVKEASNVDYLRLHIRANSNSVEDQNVKYKVKNKVVDILAPLVVGVKSKSELQEVLIKNERYIEVEVDGFLKSNGFFYKCNMEINNEFFPTRTYGDVTLGADYYDALIINLGSGVGDNWWCVIYPPLCFVGENLTAKNVVYKSKLMEIIHKFFKC